MPANHTYASLEQRISERNRRRSERYAAAKAEKEAQASFGICIVALTGTNVYRSSVSIDIESAICAPPKNVGPMVSPMLACFGQELDQNGLRNDAIQGSDKSKADVMTCDKQTLADTYILQGKHHSLPSKEPQKAKTAEDGIKDDSTSYETARTNISATYLLSQ